MTMQAVNAFRPDPSPERLHPAAGFLCLVGVFGHIMVCGAVLFALGVDYATFGSFDKSEGAIYEKIHPGTYFIYLALLAMLCRRGNPIRQAFLACWQDRTAWLLLFFYVLLLAFMVARSGP